MQLVSPQASCGPALFGASVPPSLKQAVRGPLVKDFFDGVTFVQDGPEKINIDLHVSKAHTCTSYV